MIGVLELVETLCSSKSAVVMDEITKVEGLRWGVARVRAGDEQIQ